MRWALSNRFDKAALPLADRHYNAVRGAGQERGPPEHMPTGPVGNPGPAP